MQVVIPKIKSIFFISNPFVFFSVSQKEDKKQALISGKAKDPRALFCNVPQSEVEVLKHPLFYQRFRFFVWF